MPRYWAMRQSRQNRHHREFLKEELYKHGRLRQGWGYDAAQNIHCIQKIWNADGELSDQQKEAAGHWWMGNGLPEDGYMQCGDIISVVNVPDDGFLTICRVTGKYCFDIPLAVGDLGHIRPVEIITPRHGISKYYRLVTASLRQSLFRPPRRMWNLDRHAERLSKIVETIENGETDAAQLTESFAPEGRAEQVITEAIRESLKLIVDRLSKKLPEEVAAADWEPLVLNALKQLYPPPASVLLTAGPHEHGADIDVIIPNVFEFDRDFIVPVQVKDYKGSVGPEVTRQLEQAVETRKEKGRIIAVVLIVTNATASDALKQAMKNLEKTHRVPFIFCGREMLMELLAMGNSGRS